MTTTTDSYPSDTLVERHDMRGRSPRRITALWVAIFGAFIVVAALAVATFAGGEVGIETPTYDPRAESFEREAHLEGQARTHGQDPTVVAATGTGSPDRVFLPGSRRVPVR